MWYHPAQRNIVWTVLFSLFTILSLNACSDSNNVTGPPPPVPLSPDAKLSSLTVNSGPLDPVFSGDIANYAVNVATAVTSVTVTAQPQNANASMTINGQATASGQARTITLGAAGSNTPIPIVVTAVSGSQNTYIITVNRAAPGGNSNLQSLTVSPGPLAPPFAAATTSYTVDVGTAVTSITVTARAQDAGASVSINGQLTTSRSVSLGAPGSNTPIPIVVTAPNGSQNTYIMTVNRMAPGGNNNLQSLTVSPGPLAPPFGAPGISGLPGYKVAVASGVASVTVTAQAQDAGATVSINNQTTTSLLVPLGAEGSSTLVTIEATAPNGNPKNYFVTVNRAALPSDAGLSNLQVSTGTLSPLFAAPGISGTPGYAVTVPNATTSITVTSVKADPSATLTISPSATVNNLPVGNTVFTIEVKALNGNQLTYFVTVNRAAFIPSGNNNLSALAVSAGALNEPFDAGTVNYTVTLASTTADTTVIATVADSTATLTINGSPATSGAPSTSISLVGGANPPILVVVTAENLSTKTYMITITVVP